MAIVAFQKCAFQRDGFQELNAFQLSAFQGFQQYCIVVTPEPVDEHLSKGAGGSKDRHEKRHQHTKMIRFIDWLFSPWEKDHCKNSLETNLRG